MRVCLYIRVQLKIHFNVELWLLKRLEIDVSVAILQSWCCNFPLPAPNIVVFQCILRLMQGCNTSAVVMWACSFKWTWRTIHRCLVVDILIATFLGSWSFITCLTSFFLCFFCMHSNATNLLNILFCPCILDSFSDEHPECTRKGLPTQWQR